MRLENKVAVITGSGRGIGRSTAELFAAEGASVVINGRTKEEIEAVAAGIRTRGGQAIAVPWDIGQPDAAERLVQAAEEQFGSVDILINNAAIFKTHDFVQDSYADWMKVLEVNL